MKKKCYPVSRNNHGKWSLMKDKGWSDGELNIDRCNLKDKNSRKD